MINIKMQPTDVQKLAPKIAVIGVGGAGGNAVNNMIASNLEGCEFVVCNTDSQALENSLCHSRVQLGTLVTGGLGAGSKPEVGKAAAEESLEEVLQYLQGANMAFVTAGMGGGTGSGAAPIIAKACRERGILTVGVVTKPFHFEGSHRMKVAERSIQDMQQYVDTLIVIPNQNLFRIANEKTTFAQAFRMADGVLQSGVRGVTDLMVRPGLVNLDFADIRTAMMEMGKAMMGTGESMGEKRAIEAAEAAINNPLLDDVSMKGARGVIINVTGGYDMTLFEADEACNRIRDEVDPDANIIFGATFDDSLEGIMRVSIIATGIEREADRKSRTSGGFGTTEAVGKTGFERAQPNAASIETSAQQQASTPLVAPSSAIAQSSVSAYVPPAQNIRAMTAPTPLASQGQASSSPDPETDMFEQREFAALSDKGEVASVPQNTALRGARYKDSFIPPRPMTISENEQAPQSSSSGTFHGRAQRSVSAENQITTSSAIKRSPPQAKPAATAKRSPSLFERITGSVQQHLEGFREEAASPREKTTMSPSISENAMAVPARPSQGSLNISAPSAKPRGASEDELDIPAFLRRQAN